MTETATRSWVDTVLEQHRHLQSVEADLKKFLNVARPEAREKGSHTWAVELSQRLLSLHDELFRHFRFEEDSGVKEEVMVDHPEAAGRFDEILSGHSDILGRLRGIVSDVLSYSEGVSPEDARIRRRVTDLLDTLSHHEQEENHLFQRIEYRDLTAAD
jgi:hypothetical protein